MGNNEINKMSPIEKIQKFCKNNKDIVESGVIKGLDPVKGKVVLIKGGIKKEITVDELDQFDFDNFEIKKVEKQIDNVESLDVLVNKNIEEEIESLDETVNETNIVTLEDMRQCAAKKDEKSIDKALSKFAIDSSGKININKAINVVIENSTENVIECMRDNKKLPTSLAAYDMQGKCIVEKENFEGNEPESLIDSSFNNVLVYMEVAKLKNITFTDEQIKNEKEQYKTKVNVNLNALGLNKQKEENKVVDFETKKQEKQMALQLRPDTSIKKAGFADIIILTMIVLIYAAIIINLIMKIK